MADLSWVFSLFDKASGPATKIAAALGKTVAQLDAATDGTSKLTRAQRAAMNTQAKVISAYARFVTALSRVAAVQNVAAAAQAKINAQQARGALLAQRLAVAQAKQAAAATRIQAANARAAAGTGGGGRGGGGIHGGGSGSFGLGGGFGALVRGYIGFRIGAHAVEALYDAVSAIPKAIVKGGIEHTAMKESAVAGMGVVLNDPKRAENLIQEAVRFAAVTPMTTGEAIKLYQQLVMGGMDPGKIKRTAMAVSDLSSINMARRPEAVSTISQDLMQIMAKNALDMRHLTMLSHWGLPREELYKQLSSGLVVGLKGATNSQVVDAIKAGRISAEAFFEAFERAMAAKGGGFLGGISEKQSTTILGLWSTLISRPQELMMQMDKTPSWGKLRRVLENLVDATDYTKPTGAKIQASLESAFDRIVTPLLEWLENPKAVTAFVDGLIADFKAIVPAFHDMATTLPVIAMAMSRAAGILGFAVDASKYGIVNAAFMQVEKRSAEWNEAANRSIELESGGGKPSGRAPTKTWNWNGDVIVTVDGASAGTNTESVKKAAEDGARKGLASMYEQMAIENASHF